MTPWPVVRLDEIAEVRLGRQRSPKNHSGDDMRPYLRAANVGWDGLLLDDVKMMNFTSAELETYRLEPGDLLLSEASGSRSEVGKAALWQGEIADCAFQNTLLRVRPRKASSRYLLHYFRYLGATGGFADRSRGVGIHHLGRKALARLPTPLPPTYEQDQIASALDRAEDLRTQRQRALSLFNDLAEATFLNAFGDPVRNARGWQRVPLGELLDSIDSGTSPVCLDRPAGNGEWGVLKLSAVTSCVFRPDQNKALPSDVTPKPRDEVQPSDVLFTRKNTRELVGACAVVDSPPPRLLLPDLIFRLKVRPTSGLLPVFLQRLLTTPTKRLQVQALAGGSAGSMPNISKARLAAMPIELPPLDVQREFETRITGIANQRQLSDRQLSGLADLGAALQARAFRGEL